MRLGPADAAVYPKNQILIPKKPLNNLKSTEEDSEFHNSKIGADSAI